MARQDQVRVRTPLGHRQAPMAATQAAQTVQGRRAVRRATMAATAARMAAHQRHLLVRRLPPVQTRRTQHRAAQEAGCGHSNSSLLFKKYVTLVT